MADTTTSRRHERRRTVATTAAAALAVGAVSVAVGALGIPGSESATTTAPSTARVVEAQLHDVRAVVTATRTRGDTATVRLTVQTRRPGGWRTAGTHVVGQRRGLLWTVVRGPAAVCDFSMSSTPRPTVELRLLVTNGIGCDPVTRHYHVEEGALVPC